jgi:hypothetical protein
LTREQLNGTTAPSAQSGYAIHAKRTTDDSRLAEAYESTTFTAATELGRIEIRTGATPDLLSTLMAKHECTAWAYITACNPASAELMPSENDQHQAQLRAELAAGGYRIYDGEGIGDNPAWAPESSFLALGISCQDAVALGRKFGQNAIVVGSTSDVAKLVWC